MTDPKTTTLPRKYVFHINTQRCACGVEHKWTQVYSSNNMASRTGTGKLVVNLIPIHQFDYNLPVELVFTPTTKVPVCHSCMASLSLIHLPDPTNTDEWRRIYSVAPAPGSPDKPARDKKPPKPLPTFEDLIF